MPSIYELKPAFQKLLRPLCSFLAKIGITANQVTVSASVFSLFTGGLILYYHERFSQIFFIVPVVMFLRMALNAIDGMLAREFNMKSNLGAVLNELGDVISDAALYLPFAVVFSDYESYLVILIVIFSVISEMTGVVSVQIGASRRYDGPMGKSDRAFVFGWLAFLMGLQVDVKKFSFYLLAGVLLLLVLTVINRARAALKEVVR